MTARPIQNVSFPTQRRIMHYDAKIKTKAGAFPLTADRRHPAQRLRNTIKIAAKNFKKTTRAK